jgi:putative membrane protein
MRSIALLALATAALTLGACGKQADTTVQNSIATTTTANLSPAAPEMSAGQTFANAAAASDAFEVATSNLAIEKSQSAKVKAFAKQMVKAHTDSTEKLKTAAASASPAITPDAMPNAEQAAKLQELQGLSGADFDKAYAAAQVDGHDKTLAALKDYAAGGDVPQLKTFASGLVPTVTAHLNMAKGLKP